MDLVESVQSGTTNLAAFIGGTAGGLLHCATTFKVSIGAIALVSNDNIDFLTKSIIGGFIGLGIKLLGEWIIYRFKKNKGE